jgi:hypothetical protein
MKRMYDIFYLTDNPFPARASIVPESSDPRENGMIYDEDVFAAAVHDLRRKIARRVSFIYAENFDYEEGVGKSALITREWRNLQTREGVTSVYVRPALRFKPPDFATEVIARWHHQGWLWQAFSQCLQLYAGEPGATVTRESMATLFSRHPLPPESLNLRPYGIHNVPRLTIALAQWARSLSGAMVDGVAEALFGTYLTRPQDFIKEYPKAARKLKLDSIGFFRGLILLMKLGGFEHHFLFFDQFEELIANKRGSALVEFSIGMRSLIESTSNHATIVVTLHPRARDTLDTPEAKHFTSLAPMDPRHVIELEPLDAEGAMKVTRIYLDAFRSGDPPHPFFPFDRSAIERLSALSDGIVRKLLQMLHQAIEVAADLNVLSIDRAFIDEHQRDIAGTVSFNAI